MRLLRRYPILVIVVRLRRGSSPSRVGIPLVVTGLAVVLGCGLATCFSENRANQSDCFPRETPLCGEECANTCGGGCRECLQGDTECRNGHVLRCGDGKAPEANQVRTAYSCFSVADECADGTCVAPGASLNPNFCARSVNDCDAIRAAYEATIFPSQGGSVVAVVREGSGLAPDAVAEGCPDDCAVVHGDCNAGLGTCWLVGWRTDTMDFLADLYQRMGCPPVTSTCNCAPLGVQLTCRQTGTYGDYRSACVVQP